MEPAAGYEDMKMKPFCLLKGRLRCAVRTGLAGTAAALLLAGCMVGPDYHRPQVATPVAYRELPGWTQAAPSEAGLRSDWWTGFHDPLLNQLEPLVSVSNQTVRLDYYNYQEAVDLVREARSGLFPTISVSSSATRSGNSATIANAGALEGDVSWAPDLWGQVRRTIEERAANAQATEAMLAYATLSEQVTLAIAVINLRASDANIDLLEKTVKAYEGYLRVISDQDEAGTIPPSDLILARTQLESARSSLIALQVSRAKYAHAIAVLVGRNPEDLDVGRISALPVLPDVPVSVPSTLLQRRPDIATAERQMAEENAAIGVAVSAYYPTVTLSGMEGLAESPLSGLLHAANYVWSLGAAASQTIFDGGFRSANVDATKAAYNGAVANYRNTVLTAFQNVEDDFASLRILEQQSQVLDGAVRDAARGAEIAFNEYQAGTVDYTTVATAQTTQLSLQQTALSVEQERLVASATLLGDLGGGWSADQLHDPRGAHAADRTHASQAQPSLASRKQSAPVITAGATSGQ
jgi:NodT family efflux transporter outer membrane factor (OMF) lipoprotein